MISPPKNLDVTRYAATLHVCFCLSCPHIFT